jgi:hypothetical protein
MTLRAHLFQVRRLARQIYLHLTKTLVYTNPYLCNSRHISFLRCHARPFRSTSICHTECVHNHSTLDTSSHVLLAGTNALVNKTHTKSYWMVYARNYLDSNYSETRCFLQTTIYHMSSDKSFAQSPEKRCISFLRLAAVQIT